MSGRGVLFALAPADQQRLCDAAELGDEAVWSLVHDELEETIEGQWTFATDKAWDAIHRCLTDGRLDYDNGSPPLNRAIMAGFHQVEGGGDVVSVTPAEDVPAVAEALEQVTRDWLCDRYFAIDPTDYALSKQDFEYTWSNFEGLPEFYRRAADAGDRAVVFTVDF